MQCGLSTYEGDMKMQDDLAALFSKQMSMDSMEYREAPSHSPPSSQASPITYSITQHYHHSSHVARHVTTEDSTPKETLVGGTSASVIGEALRSHDIDPASLSPGQFDLFANAAPEQRSRLIQMWQICPETSKTDSFGAMDRIINESSYQWDGLSRDMEMDDLSQDKRNGDDHDGQQYAEPYMASGYELLAQRDYEISSGKAVAVAGFNNDSSSLPNEPSTGSPYKVANDPIYQSKRWWEHAASEPIEHQYGSFEQMNRYPGRGLVQSHWL
ncbi:hypothetical protein MW887_008595 [Aspergillus wentii]|nr:hypothetical protein MW887_008595 [Aspergillus wentii]